MHESMNLDPNDIVVVAGTTPRDPHANAQLHFPFRAYTIARKARSPGQSELNYQFADAVRQRQESESSEGSLGGVPMPRGFDLKPRRSGAESDGGFPAETRKLVDEQIHREEDIGEKEEEGEIELAARQDGAVTDVQLAPPIGEDKPDQRNVGAALREDPEDDVVEDRLEENRSERKRVRREKLSERLKQVFDLEEQEEVLEEMRCWLLRSVSECIILRAKAAADGPQCSRDIYT